MLLVIVAFAAHVRGRARARAQLRDAEAPSVLAARDGVRRVPRARAAARVRDSAARTRVRPGSTSAPWRFLLSVGGVVTLGVTLLLGAAAMRRRRRGLRAPRRERADARGPPRRRRRRARRRRGSRKQGHARRGRRAVHRGRPARRRGELLHQGRQARARRRDPPRPEPLPRVGRALRRRRGKPDSAGAIYAQQEKWDLAAEAYVVAGNLSRRGRDVREGRQRPPRRRSAIASATSRAMRPRRTSAAKSGCSLPSALEQVLLEEGRGAPGDAQKHAEHQKLVRMTGNLFERGGRLDRALDVLAKDGAYVAAAEVAQKSGKRRTRGRALPRGTRRRARGGGVRGGRAGRARRADPRRPEPRPRQRRGGGAPVRARRRVDGGGRPVPLGRALRQGRRVLRALRRHRARRARCSRSPGTASARRRTTSAPGAIPRRPSCSRSRATARAKRICSRRRATACARAASTSRPAAIDEAIGALQKVGPDHADFAGAAALLGRIFRDREQYPLAIAKLREALGSREIDRKNLDAYFCLATIHEANGDWREAVDLYEKVLAFDYSHEDTAERLERARTQLAAEAAPHRAGRGVGHLRAAT